MTTQQKHILYILLAGLLVCGFLFVTTPVTAQETTNLQLKELKESIDKNTARLDFLFWFVVIFLPIIVLFSNRLWGKVSKLEGVWDVVKNFVDKRDKTESKRNNFKALEKDVISTSPLGLSSTGREKLEKSGAKAFIDKYFDELYKHFDGIKTNYEVHDKAIEVIQGVYKNNVNFTPVKRYAYNEGIEDFVLMVAIELRDRVCNKKDIKIKDRVAQHKN